MTAAEAEREQEADYEWFKATIDGCTGQVVFTYQVKGLPTAGSQGHDEPVGEYTDKEIQQLAHDLLDVEPDKVEVIWN